MSSYLISTVPIDATRVADDLRQVEPCAFVDSYDEFVCGSWRTCMLWNATGDGRDATIRDYQGTARATEHGGRLAHVGELMAEHFNLEYLRFARLTRLSPGSVVVPHRDYVELESELVRIHVPLVTAPEAYVSEAETIYHMGVGEVWFLDAVNVHSIANFSDVARLHLLLDFAAPDPFAVLRRPPNGQLGIPTASTVARRPLRADERVAFRALAGVVDRTNVMDVMALLIKRYFVADMRVLDVFGWMREIAADSGDPDVQGRVRWLESHSLTSR